MKSNLLTTLALMSSLGFLLSCAQGSGDYSATGPQTSEVGCGSMQNSECEMFVAINQYRSNQNLPAYGSQSNCIAMAESHATDMYQNNYFSNDGLHQTFNQRLEQYKLSKAYATESIARGSSSVNVILNLLEKSSGDNSALLSTLYKSIGVGFDNGYWTICYTSI